jgi:WD40 repeat protein
MKSANPECQPCARAGDSDHILCACYKRGLIQCFSVKDEQWTCKIDEGPAGCVHARWSPSGTHVISVAEFHVRMSVWSLVDKSCIYIKAPKFDNKGLDFSADGKFLAMAERRECKDAVSVISTETWTIAAHFTTATTDLANLKWSPDSTSIAVWDAALDYLLLLYSPDGRLLHRYQAYDGGLGIKAVSWSPGGQLLAAGSYDQRCRVLNHVTWWGAVQVEFSRTHSLKAPGFNP